MSQANILVVDNEPNIRRVLKGLLEQKSYHVFEAEDGVDALTLLKKEEIHTIITDLKMPNLDGLGLLQALSSQYPDIPVIMITAHQTVDSAIRAMKMGALDYISKPFDRDEMLMIVRKALEHYQKRKQMPWDEALNSDLVTQSPQMQSIKSIIQKVADSPSTVIITGESGTGKELVAKALHDLSQRKEKAFIAINCSAIPATLIESELFGYEKGAFTGAVTSKPGRFELADEGTLFLDEIAEIPLELQAKLLRAIQENEIERVGGLKTKKINIRLIVATNRDLKGDVESGRFRQDLFYRLNVVPIELPPLRNRKEDFEPLVDFFIQKYNKRLEKRIKAIDTHALDVLKEYHWPGNIRQLENVIERMVLLSEGTTLQVSNIPDEISQITSISIPAFHPDKLSKTGSFKDIVKETTGHVERNLILKALEETHGNVSRAAKNLGISRKSLQNKIKEYGVLKP